jgi:hypothetical protein
MSTFINDDGERAELPEDAVTLTVEQARELDKATLAFVQDWLYRAARQFTEQVTEKYLNGLPGEVEPGVRISAEADQLIGAVLGMENLLGELAALNEVGQTITIMTMSGLAPADDMVVYASVATVPDPSEPLFTTVEAV